MPPGQKAKKGGRDVRRSNSRNSTPISTGASITMPTSETTETALLEIPIKSLKSSSYDDLVEQHTGAAIPDSKGLDALIERLNQHILIVNERARVCDRGMRLLSANRKERAEELETERRDQERKERTRVSREAEEEERGRKASKMKKRKDTSITREQRPLTHGAHGLAPQDGSNLRMLPTFLTCRVVIFVTCRNIIKPNVGGACSSEVRCGVSYR